MFKLIIYQKHTFIKLLHFKNPYFYFFANVPKMTKDMKNLNKGQKRKPLQICLKLFVKLLQ